MNGCLKKRIWFWLLLLIIVGVVSSLFFVVRYSSWTYDMLYKNTPVKSLSDAKAILDQYPTVKFLDLPAQIKQPFYDTKYNIQKTSANNNSLNINLLLQILTINILTVQSVFLILNFFHSIDRIVRLYSVK